MLLAALALLLHGANTMVQQAAAATGFFPIPATLTVGSFHSHGHVAHSHHDMSPGHVHHADDHHQDLDEHPAVIWSIGCAPGIVPAPALTTLSLVLSGKLEGTPLQHRQGVGPYRLSRPPSTPSIA
jgi:hypothetical protein